jgi:hypothetical protein
MAPSDDLTCVRDVDLPTGLSESPRVVTTKRIASQNDAANKREKAESALHSTSQRTRTIGEEEFQSSP